MSRRHSLLPAACIGALLAMTIGAVNAQARPSSQAQVRQAVASIHSRFGSHGQRLDAISRLFVGAPYQLSPLGEGASGRIDRVPLVRFDRFDCVTFVEEVMALAWSRTVNDR